METVLPGRPFVSTVSAALGPQHLDRAVPDLSHLLGCGAGFDRTAGQPLGDGKAPPPPLDKRAAAAVDSGWRDRARPPCEGIPLPEGPGHLPPPVRRDLPGVGVGDSHRPGRGHEDPEALRHLPGPTGGQAGRSLRTDTHWSRASTGSAATRAGFTLDSRARTSDK